MEQAAAALAARRQSLRLQGEELPPPRTVEHHQAAGTFGDAVRWDTVELADQRFSPRDFMRARRPELYSHLAPERQPIVDKTFLNFALAQLTEEKKEIQFETFCRKLAEKEICPNLLPQTGPTGGGDSKVDSETYPVSDAIADRWYIGDPQRASRERWAFAISAKKNWRSKAKDDVRKVVETGRSYAVVYFLTNQQVSDRNRGSLEDELRDKWHIDCRILDRNWIADRVLTNGHYALFESTLQIDLGGTTTRPLAGGDVDGQRELEELEGQIEDQHRYVSGYELAQDCLQAALLVRRLGRSRVEIDGRFDRAERIARQHSNRRQLLWITYHRAWTAFWWHEDYATFDSLFRVVESLGVDTDNVWDLERVAILWQLGTTWRRNEGELDNDEDWNNHTTQLRNAIRRIADDDRRPTSSLMARTLEVMMAVAEAPEALPSHLQALGSILEATENHPAYPFDSIARLVEELANMAAGDGRLDDLLEKVLQMRTLREGEAQEGLRRLNRAAVCLEARRPLESVRQAGKAQTLLGRGGDVDGLFKALMTTAAGYESMGLLWASRANCALALHWALEEWHTTGELPATLCVPLRRLTWTEIQLGRIPNALCWLELQLKLAPAANLTKDQVDRFVDEMITIDAALAIAALRTQWTDLAKLDRAPAVFGGLGLVVCRSAMMFLLGYEAAVTDEAGIDDVEAFIGGLLRQPGARDILEVADWGIGRSHILRTTLFGCQIDLLARGGSSSLLLGETILAFLESFAATSDLTTGQLASRSHLEMEVVVREDAEVPFGHDLVEDSVGDVKIVVAHSGQVVSSADERHLRELIAVLGAVVGQLWMAIPREEVRALFEQERAHDRASLTAQLPTVLNGVLGGLPKCRALDWMGTMSESLALCRATPWRADLETTSHEEVGDSGGTPPHSGSGIDGIRHKDVNVLSVVNGPLWERAGWSGMAYMFSRHSNDVPQVQFLFKNIEAGRKIFLGWLKKFGASDPEDTIDIVLVTGINPAHRNWYRIVVGHRVERARFDVKLSGVAFRIQEVQPESDHNLRQFVERYRRLGRYRIAPVEHLAVPGVFRLGTPPDIVIEKRRLRIVPASSIGPNDILRVALRSGDEEMSDD